ncbi:hypothetical protein [Methylovorus glucosotrophus]|uniref:Primosome, DnaD subunit n=1 Tax=Methylovorus glucosotrophus (strain SIP3-4) TaxID=582744 RepID=C6X7T6_METGS|nr:hypothetical protein [Methylovorus glucosotrophus]ACT51263.1 primosome, DnaD subunit [Methylovorus glucosotrophus SIP3-4]
MGLRDTWNEFKDIIVGKKEWTKEDSDREYEQNLKDPNLSERLNEMIKYDLKDDGLQRVSDAINIAGYINENPNEYQHLDAEWKDDKMVTIAAVSHPDNQEMLQYASDRMKDDIEVVQESTAQNRQYASDRVHDEIIKLEDEQYNINKYGSANPTKEDVDRIEKYEYDYEQSQADLIEEQIADYYEGQEDRPKSAILTESISNDLKQSEETPDSYYNHQFTSIPTFLEKEEWKDSLGYNINPEVIENIKNGNFDNKEWVMKHENRLAENPDVTDPEHTHQYLSTFEHVSERLRNDKEVIDLYCQDDYFNYNFIGKELMNDKEYLIDRVNNKEYISIEKLSDTLKDDKEFLNKVMDNTDFKYVSDRLKDDKEFVISKIEKFSIVENNTEFASERLKNDYDFNLEAYSKHKYVGFINPKFMNNEEFLKDLISIEPRVYFVLDETHQNNQALFNHAYESYKDMPVDNNYRGDFITYTQVDQYDKNKEHMDKYVQSQNMANDFRTIIDSKQIQDLHAQILERNKTVEIPDTYITATNKQKETIKETPAIINEIKEEPIANVSMTRNNKLKL